MTAISRRERGREVQKWPCLHFRREGDEEGRGMVPQPPSGFSAAEEVCFRCADGSRKQHHSLGFNSSNIGWIPSCYFLNQEAPPPPRKSRSGHARGEGGGASCSSYPQFPTRRGGNECDVTRHLLSLSFSSPSLDRRWVGL